jgi:hypothetical protein
MSLGGAMKKRALIIPFVLILLTIPLFMGCFPTKTATTVEYISKGTFQEAIDSINDDLDKLDENKANDSSLKTFKEEVDTRFRNFSGANSYDKSQTFTKDEVNTAISTAIATLKNDQSWITKSSSSSSSDSTDEGDVIATSGELELSLDREVDSSLPIPDDSWSEYIRLTVTNKGGSTYYRINVDFDADEDVLFATYPVLSFSVDNNADAYMFCTTANARTDNAASTPWTQTTSNLSFSSRNSSGQSKLWIGKEKSESMFLKLYCNYDGTGKVREWDWDVSLKEID